MPDLRGCGRSTTGLDDDQYTPDAAVADLVALLGVLGLGPVDVLGLPDARAVIIDDAGHMAHVDQPENWLAALAGFLDSP